MASNLITLIEDVLGGLNTSVDLIEPIIDTLVIDLAEGVWLDTIAEIVGCPPRTRNIDNTSPVSDSELRKRINVQIELNNGGSTYEVVQNAVRFYLYLYADDITNDWESVKDSPTNISYGNATVLISTSGNDSSYVGEIKKFLPVGVGLFVLQFTDNPFVVDDLTGAEPNGGGCGDLNDPWYQNLPDLTPPTDISNGVGGNLAYFIDTNTK